MPAATSRPEQSIIVVGVDDGDASRRALAWAADEALRRGSTLELVTTWSWDTVDGTSLVPVDPRVRQAAAEQVQQEAVDAVLTPLDPCPAFARIVVQSAAADALVMASRHADLVVVGTHGRGPVRSFFLGSVSQGVIANSNCPVVVLPVGHQRPVRHEELATAATASTTTAESS